VEYMICNIPWRICYGSENFGLGSPHPDDVGFAGATPPKLYLKSNDNCVFRLSFSSRLKVVTLGYFNIQLTTLLSIRYRYVNNRHKVQDLVM
jgi:hypothetical protein